MFDRVASFISYLSRLGRDPSQGPWGEPGGAPAQNFVLVTHGLLMRIFCMCAAAIAGPLGKTSFGSDSSGPSSGRPVKLLTRSRQLHG